MWTIRLNKKKYLDPILDCIFPVSCYLCRSTKEKTSLCTPCLNTLSKAYTTPYPWIASTYSFKDERVKKIIHAIKYFHRKDLLPPLILHASKDLTMYKGSPYILVPIPMPKIRKYRRGHNHTESIANNLSDILSLESSESELYTHASLFAKRQVSTQSRYERLKNKKNTFYTKNRNLNTHILLIDDVTTTGATLLEARKTLEKAGATHVYAYTLAH